MSGNSEDAALREAIREATSPSAEGAAARVAARLVERAEQERILDVAYCEVDSPFGSLLLAATDQGLVRISYPVERIGEVLDELAARISPRVLEAPARLDRPRRELDEYFEGRRRAFEVELDRRLTTGFTLRVLEQTSRIPFGETRSYAEIARAAGSPRAHRAAGSALGANPIPIVVPCHRVLRSGGALGGYGGGLETKRRLLTLEGTLG